MSKLLSFCLRDSINWLIRNLSGGTLNCDYFFIMVDVLYIIYFYGIIRLRIWEGRCSTALLPVFSEVEEGR